MAGLNYAAVSVSITAISAGSAWLVIKNRIGLCFGGKNESDQIQCIVSNGLADKNIPFGQTQKPKLWDYADDVDTLKFLISI